MATIVHLIFVVFGVWLGWRLITWKMRRTVVARELSTQYIVLEEEWKDGVRIIKNAKPVGVALVDVTQYEIFRRIAHMLWHNAKKKPRWMLSAILNVLRRPRP